MAKVKNPQLPVYEVLTYENPDDPYTLGDAWRGTLTEGYLQYFDDEDYTVKKSSRGERPSQKGFDLDIQLKWREAFAACVDVWRNLPNECSEAQTCYVGASKQSVWAAKQEYGVVCSYYDLFMKCCLSSYRESADWNFNPEDCFPCPQMFCEGVSIGYTTQQMSIGEDQALTAEGLGEGVECTWEIESGGGSLSSNTGQSVVYTAPGVNENCEANPTIVLGVCGVVCATLDIAVNGSSSPSIAYRIVVCEFNRECWESGGQTNCKTELYHYNYGCTGDYIGKVYCDGASKVSAGSYPCPGYCTGAPGPVIPGCAGFPVLNCCGAVDMVCDVRSEAMKAAGCCPEALL